MSPITTPNPHDDQQDQADRSLQQQQGNALVACQDRTQRLRADREPGRFDEGAESGAIGTHRTDALGIAPDDRIALGLDLGQVRTGRESGDAARELMTALAIAQLFLGEGEGHEQLEVAVREHEAFRHHADHLPFLAVDAQVTADDVGVGVEAVAPQCVAEHDDLVIADLRFVLGEGPAQRRTDAEGRKKRRSGAQGLQALRSGFGREIETGPGVERDVGQGRDTVATVDVVRNGHAGALRAGLHVTVAEVDQAGIVAIRQGLEEKPVDQTEDERVRTDAERQGQHDRSRESRTGQQCTQGIADIVDQGIEHHCFLTRDAMQPLDRHRAHDAPAPGSRSQPR